jgi:hypothetical protein
VVKLILSLLFLSGCGPLPYPDDIGPLFLPQNVEIDARLLPYVAEYYRWTQVYDVLPFGEVSRIACVDHIDVADPDTILVGQTEWVLRGSMELDAQIVIVCSGPPVYQKSIVFHELTHAVFELGHTKRPKEIQNEYVPTVSELKNWRLRVHMLFLFIMNGGDSK